jgi:hypothetical protein
MALTVSTQVSPVATKLVIETISGATSNNNVLGTSGKVYMVDVDNAANAAATYCKLYDDGNPVVGTTAPHFIFRVPAGQRRSMVIPEGMDFSILSFACVTTPGTTGTTAPSSPVAVRLACA